MDLAAVSQFGRAAEDNPMVTWENWGECLVLMGGHLVLDGDERDVMHSCF